MTETVWLQGERGAVLTLPAPLPESVAQRVASGEMQVITPPAAQVVPPRPGEPEKPPAAPVKPVVPVPNRGASRADWAAYALAEGMDPQQVEGMTRNQIANAISARS